MAAWPMVHRSVSACPLTCPKEGRWPCHPAAAPTITPVLACLRRSSFIHVVVNYGEYTPDGWGINANEAGMATAEFRHVAGIPCLQKGLSTLHWQVHIQHEAF